MSEDDLKLILETVAGEKYTKELIQRLSQLGYRIVPAAEIEAREEKHREALYLAHKEIEKLEARLAGVDAGTHQIVPKEADTEMLNRAVDATRFGAGMSWNGISPQSLLRKAYRAMLAAAPAEGEKE